MSNLATDNADATDKTDLAADNADDTDKTDLAADNADGTDKTATGRRGSAAGICTALAVMLLASHTAGAQDDSCESISSRPAIVAGVGLHSLRANVWSPLAQSTTGDAISARKGPVLRAIGEIPARQGVGVRIEHDRSILPVEASTGWDGMVSASHTGLGIVRHRRSDGAFCGYAALTAGVHTFSYRGHRSSSPGLSGALGFNVASDGHVNPFFEMSLSAFGEPLAFYDNAYSLNLMGGARFRF